MRIKDPLMSDDARGLFGEEPVFGKWKLSNWVRHWRKTPNPNTAGQFAWRDNFRRRSREYKTLNAGQKADWAQYGQDNPRTDIWGEPYKLTGAQEYLALGMIAEKIGEIPSGDPPPPPALIAIENLNYYFFVGFTEWTWSAGQEGKVIEIQITDDTVSEDDIKPWDYYTDSIVEITEGEGVTLGVPYGVWRGHRLRRIRIEGELGPWTEYKIKGLTP